jgi:hypothetical protein
MVKGAGDSWATISDLDPEFCAAGNIAGGETSTHIIFNDRF